MGFLLSFAYGMVLATTGLSLGDWQLWMLLIIYFVGRLLGYYEGSHA